MAAVGEELIFRGFIQTRLLRRFSPLGAIVFTSLFFAIPHGDVHYALAIFPLGLWFGYVAYLAESVWPSVICHFLHNSVAFLARMTPSESPEGATPQGGTGDPAMIVEHIVAGMLAVLLVWWMSSILRKRQRPRVVLVTEH